MYPWARRTQKSEPTEAVIAGNCSEMEEMSCMVLSVTRGVSFQHLMSGSWSLPWLSFQPLACDFGHKERNYVRGLAGELPSL